MKSVLLNFSHKIKKYLFWLVDKNVTMYLLIIPLWNQLWLKVICIQYTVPIELTMKGMIGSKIKELSTQLNVFLAEITSLTNSIFTGSPTFVDYRQIKQGLLTIYYYQFLNLRLKQIDGSSCWKLDYSFS